MEQQTACIAMAARVLNIIYVYSKSIWRVSVFCSDSAALASAPSKLHSLKRPQSDELKPVDEPRRFVTVRFRVKYVAINDAPT